jgi:hypothetical protein
MPFPPAIKPIFVFAVAGMLLLPRVVAKQSPSAGVGNSTSSPVSRISAAQGTRPAVAALKQSLDDAKTPEEKRAVMVQWSQQNQAVQSQRQAVPAKSQQQALAELNAKADGNSQLARLQEDFCKAQENLSKVQEQFAATKAHQAKSPEMAAAQAKAGQAIQEIEELRDFLAQATSEDRANILQAWRANREQATRKKESFFFPQPSGKP